MASLVEHYKFATRLSDELCGLIHFRYGRQLWVKVKTRKTITNTGKRKRCDITGKVISKGASVYRPMTNGHNRMDRISEEGMRLLEANR